MDETGHLLRQGSREIVVVDVEDPELRELADPGLVSLGETAAEGAFAEAELLELAELEEVRGKLRVELALAENQFGEGVGEGGHALDAGGSRLTDVDRFEGRRNASVRVGEAPQIDVQGRVEAEIEGLEVRKLPQARRGAAAQKVLSQVDPDDGVRRPRGVVFEGVQLVGGEPALDSGPGADIGGVVGPARLLVPSVPVGRFEEFAEDRPLDFFRAFLLSGGRGERQQR
mmetsp:Transcript_24848/g.58304  ORF Transcript_24848/g.58304 Transcript_24848/m.58304 type:complete len:229 (+) Transcript_24848:3134-3820(+)